MRVLVAMSGGVDSSMAAALLLEEGHDVTGVHLKMADTLSGPALASGAGGLAFASGAGGLAGVVGKGCCTLDDARDARRVADRLGIPFYVWNFGDAFQERVVDDFVAEYERGRTPNPCIRCNERVKYAALLERALGAGFDALATGHHVRLRHDDGRWRLVRAADPEKDQTYVLYMASQRQLAHTRWPVGEYPKATLRAMAAERGLVTASKPDSHDICFIPSGNLDGFLRPRLGDRPGVVVGPDGQELAQHDGAYRYTVGQRRGLGLGGSPEPLYVTAIQGDEVHVGPRSSLGTEWLEAEGASWVGGTAPIGRPGLSAQVRYRGVPVPAELDDLGGGRVGVSFREQRPEGVAAGQAVVLYHDAECLGGATIVRTRGAAEQ